MSDATLDALRKLDVTNDNHWTADGLPRLDTVKMLAGNPALNRDTVEAAAPGFTRATAANYTAPEQPGAQPGDNAGQGDSTEQGANAAGSGAAPQDGGDGAATFSDDKAEQPKVETVIGSDTDEVAALEAELAEAREATQEVREAMDMVKAELAKRQAREDDLVLRLEKLTPKHSNTLAIQDYFKAQDQKLAERAARQQAIRDSGLDLKALARDLKSPLDAAMARKASRGTQRPTGI